MKTIITFLTFFSWTLSIYSQTKTQTMLDIDKVTNEIKSKLNTYTKTEKNLTESAYKYIFLNDKELKLITVKTIESTIEKNVEWYYVNGVLTYSETNWFDIISKKRVKHEQQYLNNGRLIAWVSPEDKLVDITSLEFRNLDTELNAYGVQLKNDALKYD